jgi:hypothetical protein
MKKNINIIIGLILSIFISSAQNKQTLQVDEVTSRMQDVTAKVQNVDLDGDGDLDLIFSYQYSEAENIKVYMNVGDKPKLVLDELFKYMGLSDKDKKLTIDLWDDDGDSFIWKRIYTFEKDRIKLLNSYVSFNSAYALGKGSVIPANFLSEPYYVHILTDYNLRYTPSLELLNASTEDNWKLHLTCKESTNIIGLLKAGTALEVLAEYKTKDRNWLYVEVSGKALDETCTLISFPAEEFSLRGWISDKNVRKVY